MALTKMYLYLARRDKTGVKLLTAFMGEPVTGRVDVKTLNLPPDLLTAVEEQIQADRMLWEPWVQPAESFHQLKDQLSQKGFSNLPMSSNPTVKFQRGQVAKTSQLTPVNKVMLQKKT